VEEEASTSEIAEKLKMIKESANGLFMLDSVLGKRE
jgi:ferritin